MEAQGGDVSQELSGHAAPGASLFTALFLCLEKVKGFLWLSKKLSLPRGAARWPAGFVG